MSKSKIPELHAIRRLPTAEEMAVEMAGKQSPALYGTEAQAAAAAMRIHACYRLREAIRRGRESVDLQSTEEVQDRVSEFFRGCEISASIPLWVNICALALNLSRQYVARWMSSHPHHNTTKYLLMVKDAIGGTLAEAAIIGAASPVPSIFALKAQAGWRDSGAEEDAVEIEDEEEITEAMIRRWLDTYGDGEDATESAPATVDDMSDD